MRKTLLNSQLKPHVAHTNELSKKIVAASTSGSLK